MVLYDVIIHGVVVGVSLCCALAMNFAEHPSMNFKDFTMNPRYLSFSLSKREDGSEQPVKLSVFLSRHSFRSGSPYPKDYGGFDPEWMSCIVLYDLTIRSESYEGLATGIREVLRDFLVVLGENGYRMDNERIQASDINRFNTGNDTKLVNQFVHFLTVV